MSSIKSRVADLEQRLAGAQKTISALVLVVNDLNSTSFYLEESYEVGNTSVYLQGRYQTECSFCPEETEGASGVYMLYGMMQQQRAQDAKDKESDEDA